MQRRLIIFYFLATVGLFLYSFTQVDLGLTLTRASFFQVIQESFQYVGYFNRPLSTFLYFGIMTFLTLLYFVSLRLSWQKKLSRKTVRTIIIGMTALLAFSYNAFSYDLFNYIFDAKIVTQYQENPYEKKALDYAGDPMLGFMQWTHRVYPYGFVWLGLTVPLSFLGMQYFLLTFFLFKMFIAACFLGIVYFLEKIARLVDAKRSLFSVVFFALNPLVIIESLVSGHNDIVMQFFAIASFYFLFKKQYVYAFALLLLSIGIKFATIFLLPVFLYILYFQFRKREIPYKKTFLFSIFLMALAVVASSIYSTNFQPWYLLNVMPYAALLAMSSYVFIPTTIISIGILFHYAPFLYTGNWNPPIPSILRSILFGIITVAVFLTGAWSVRGKK